MMVRTVNAGKKGKNMVTLEKLKEIATMPDVHSAEYQDGECDEVCKYTKQCDVYHSRYELNLCDSVKEILAILDRKKK
jgi:hypothetical protein